MADTLTTAEKATIDGEDNQALRPDAFDCESSDPAVASVDGTSVVGADGIGYWFCIGQAAGTCTITATRLSDDATGTLDVEVTEVGPGSFTIHLGTHSAK